MKARRMLDVGSHSARWWGAAMLVVGVVACSGGSTYEGHDSGPPGDATFANDAAPPCTYTFHDGCVERFLPWSEVADVLAADDTHLYFSVALGASVRRAPLAGGPSEAVGTADAPIGMLDVEGGYVYYGTIPTSGMSNASVGRIAGAGGSAEPLVTGLPHNAQVAAAGGFLYFTQWGSEVARVPVTGGAKEPLIVAAYPTWIDAVGEDLYWMEMIWNSTAMSWSTVLSHAKTDFSFAENLETIAVSTPAALDGGYVYWLDHLGGTVYRTPTAKGATEPLATLTPDPVIGAGYRLGVSANYVYFVQGSPDTLSRVPRAGGAIENVLSDDFIMDFAVVSDGAFVSIGNRGVFRVRDSD